MVASSPVHAPLHRIHQQSTPSTRGTHAPCKIVLRRNGALLFLSATNSMPQTSPNPRTSPTTSRSRKLSSAILSADPAVSATAESAKPTNGLDFIRRNTARPAAAEIG